MTAVRAGTRPVIPAAALVRMAAFLALAAWSVASSWAWDAAAHAAGPNRLAFVVADGNVYVSDALGEEITPVTHDADSSRESLRQYLYPT